MLQAAKSNVRAALRGIRAIDLTPQSNYRQYVSNPKDLAERSWKATGNQLWEAVRKFVVDCVKK